MVNITPTGSDPDGDSITFLFTSPLNSSGLWLTDYDSAGTYLVTVSAYDGSLSDSQDVLITVNDKAENITAQFDLIYTGQEHDLSLTDSGIKVNGVAVNRTTTSQTTDGQTATFDIQKDTYTTGYNRV